MLRYVTRCTACSLRNLCGRGIRVTHCEVSFTTCFFHTRVLHAERNVDINLSEMMVFFLSPWGGGERERMGSGETTVERSWLKKKTTHIVLLAQPFELVELLARQQVCFSYRCPQLAIHWKQRRAAGYATVISRKFNSCFNCSHSKSIYHLTAQSHFRKVPSSLR